MASLDVFKGDGFTLTSLTAAINEQKHLPTRIGDSGLFHEEGVTTPTVQIEKQGDKLILVASADRGAPGVKIKGEKRHKIPFNTIHLPQEATIMADEVAGLVAFGSSTEAETVENYVAQRLGKMRRNNDATIEYHRIGAMQGKILDADGSTELLDLYSSFNLVKQTHSLVLGTSTTKVRLKLIEAKRKIEKKLGAVMVTGWKCYMSEGFSDSFTNHKDVLTAYERWNDGQALRDDMRDDFQFAGISFEEYRGQVGSVDFIPANKAILVPVGVPEMFVTYFAPANYAETVGTLGLPYYAKQEPLPFNKGVEIEAQSNPLCINTRPDCVIELS